MFGAFEYYGSTVIGEKGQVSVPAELRKKFGIEPGDKFLVLAGEKLGGWGIVLVKADVLSGVVKELFGGSLDELLRGERKGEPRKRK